MFPGVVDTSGDSLTPYGRIAAACLAAGANSVVSHRTAAALYGLVELPSASEAIHVSVPHGSHRIHTPGIVVHQDRHLYPAAHIHGLPVAAMATVLQQLVGDFGPNDFRCVAAEAVRRGLVTIDGLMTARPVPTSNRGVLKDVVEELHAGAISGGEAAFWRAVKDRGWPLPELNARVRTIDGDKFIDGLWRRYRLGYEIDGRSVHALEKAFVDDRRRHNALQSQGLVLMHFAVSDVFGHLDEVMATTRDFLVLRAKEFGLPAVPPG